MQQDKTEVSQQEKEYIITDFQICRYCTVSGQKHLTHTWDQLGPMPSLRHLHAGFSLQSLRFNPGQLQERFTVSDWARFITYFLLFSLVTIIPPLLHTHLSVAPMVCNSPDQAACCHILGLLSRWLLHPPQHLAGHKVMYFMNNWDLYWWTSNCNGVYLIQCSNPYSYNNKYVINMCVCFWRQNIIKQ